jgi:prepilin-type N-terminal cleavage/methylation domain-containing protein
MMKNTQRPTRPRSRGFTLAESITAIVILSISVPSMLWGVRQAHTHRANRVLASRAHWLAVERLEDVIADRHSSTRGYSYLIPANYPAEATVPGYPGYSRAVAFTETTANLSTPGSGYMRATVTVTYTDASGASRSLPLATELTNYTP